MAVSYSFLVMFSLVCVCSFIPLMLFLWVTHKVFERQASTWLKFLSLLYLVAAIFDLIYFYANSYEKYQKYFSPDSSTASNPYEIAILMTYGLAVYNG